MQKSAGCQVNFADTIWLHHCIASLHKWLYSASLLPSRASRTPRVHLTSLVASHGIITRVPSDLGMWRDQALLSHFL